MVSSVVRSEQSGVRVPGSVQPNSYSLHRAPEHPIATTAVADEPFERLGSAGCGVARGVNKNLAERSGRPRIPLRAQRAATKSQQ